MRNRCIILNGLADKRCNNFCCGGKSGLQIEKMPSKNLFKQGREILTESATENIPPFFGKGEIVR